MARGQGRGDNMNETIKNDETGVKEEMKVEMFPAHKDCPHCGRCPKCGRKTGDYIPYTPYPYNPYPWYPYPYDIWYPYWEGTSTTVTDNDTWTMGLS